MAAVEPGLVSKTSPTSVARMADPKFIHAHARPVHVNKLLHPQAGIQRQTTRSDTVKVHVRPCLSRSNFESEPDLNHLFSIASGHYTNMLHKAGLLACKVS
jgi:hypothetical protein